MLLDIAGLVAGARFDPPRRLAAIFANHFEESLVNVNRRESCQMPLELVPLKPVGLHQRRQRARQAQGAIVRYRAIENDQYGDHAQKKQRIYYRAAVLQFVKSASQFTHSRNLASVSVSSVFGDSVFANPHWTAVWPNEGSSHFIPP